MEFKELIKDESEKIAPLVGKGWAGILLFVL